MGISATHRGLKEEDKEDYQEVVEVYDDPSGEKRIVYISRFATGSELLNQVRQKTGSCCEDSKTCKNQPWPPIYS